MCYIHPFVLRAALLGLLSMLLAGGLPLLPARAHLNDFVSTSSAARDQTARVVRSPRIVIELDDQPTTQVFARVQRRASRAEAVRAAQAQLAQIEVRQRQLLPTLRRMGATVLFRTQRVYNGIATQVPADKVTAVARLPGVRAIRPLTPVRLANASSVPFIGAPQLWSSAAGLTGQNITIGVIDTGVDYIHTDFGGSGNARDYDRNDSTTLDDGLFPTEKVRGYDFVGNSYDATSDDPARTLPKPDPDPFDCYGHGTHVAGTAAGYGVNSDGSTYTGPYTESLDFSQFKIGPGVAPQATIYALKVFGCNGSATSDVIAQALEYAVDPDGDGDFADRLDVINMSLGAAGGSSLDPQAVASNNAALAGTLVAASAGNDSDAFYAAGSPGNAERVISVAASSEEPLDLVAAFSARGPGNAGSHLKPDLSAPGVSIFSAGKGTGSEGSISSGTSMAAPHIAGAAALLRQLHPTWSVEEIKALLLNTAAHDVATALDSAAPKAGLSRAGAGRVDLALAAAQNVIAYNADESGTVSVSFGSLEIVAPTTLTRIAVLHNKGPSQTMLDLAYQTVASIPGVSYTIAPAQVTLAPDAMATVYVTLQADPSAMQHTHDPAVLETQNGYPRHWISEAAGYLTMTPQGSESTTRLPIYAVARPAAQMRAAPTGLSLSGADGMTTTIALTGTGLIGSGVPTDEVSVVTAFELAYVSPLDTADQVGRNADLRYVGVASDVRATGSITETRVYFGLATQRDWTSPHQVAVQILIDADRDGRDDYVLNEWNLSSANGSGMGDVFITRVFDASTDQRIGDHFEFVNALPARPLDPLTPGLNSVPFNTNVLMLPVRAADIGLTDAQSSFNYRVVTYSADRGDTEFIGDLVAYGTPVETTPTLTYDAARPGLDLANRNLLNVPSYPDLPGTALPVVYDPAAFGQANSRGVLLLHHHNAQGQRAEIIAVGYAVALPLVLR